MGENAKFYFPSDKGEGGSSLVDWTCEGNSYPSTMVCFDDLLGELGKEVDMVVLNLGGVGPEVIEDMISKRIYPKIIHLSLDELEYENQKVRFECDGFDVWKRIYMTYYFRACRMFLRLNQSGYKLVDDSVPMKFTFLLCAA